MAPDSSIQRFALSSLDPNWNLNSILPPRKRAPITFDQENEEAVLGGVASGIYNLEEVVALTDHQGFGLPATPNEPLDSDDEALVPSPYGRNQILQDQPSSDDGSSAYGGNEDDDDEMISEDMEQDLGEEEAEDQEDDDAISGEQAPGVFFDPAALGLKEINNLAHFGVSSHKPGNGVEELLSDDLDRYWQ